MWFFGVEWLKTLGPITIYYSTLTMSFSRRDGLVTLHGQTGPHPVEATPGQVCHLIQTDRVTTFFHLQLHIPPSASIAGKDTILQALQNPLQSYSTLFQQPTSLPPSRLHDHQINLLPNSQPVHVKPYRYPYFQKHGIEIQVEEMLLCNHIRSSRSPYSSHVLLVKKKDGTWCFRVDYRALNAVIIKDRFPIPTIDELLDDLHHATWFSRMDLALGFHQIRMAPTDIRKTSFRTHNATTSTTSCHLGSVMPP